MGPQYRPQNIIILIIGTPKKGTPNFGKPPCLFALVSLPAVFYSVRGGRDEANPRLKRSGLRWGYTEDCQNYGPFLGILTIPHTSLIREYVKVRVWGLGSGI